MSFPPLCFIHLFNNKSKLVGVESRRLSLNERQIFTFGNTFFLSSLLRVASRYNIHSSVVVVRMLAVSKCNAVSSCSNIEKKENGE